MNTIDHSPWGRPDHVETIAPGLSFVSTPSHGGYFVADAHVRSRVTPHLAAGLGIDNLGARSYFLFHPFTQRTVVGDLKYSY